ncbi:Zinc finger protein [Plakobranchus ocellatus]|uniref:Zinc finger protein n=1 Tax=Plakobranchus ocellatus TaxID=259542 RepID=A0AAV4A6V0_9GAST|nr:Zinc finger protein [Plakobranchus ocellatus]
MPVGRVNTKKKDDATQKLKEIKQRQQNWLRQREQSKLKEDARPKISSAPSSSKPNESAKLSLSKKAAAIPVKQESEIQRRFKNWVSVRENGTNGKEDAAFDDNLSIVSGVESELARLVTPELPVAEEKFDDLAEKIAHKVKNDLGLSHSRASTHHTQSTDITEMGNEYPSWNSERCKTFTHDAPDFNHLNTSGLACHSCAICKKIMVSSRNIPMMIIPCGHTLCKACSEGRHNCPSCDCSIMSLTVNIMLQQVIQEYHTLPAPSGGGHNHKHKDVVMEDSTPKQRYVEDNRRNKMASYTSQLANLRTRHDILIAEQTGLQDSQKQLSSKIRQDEAQLASVMKQEQEIEKAILDLHERLAALQEHKEHYETQVSEMKEEKCKVDGKVTLLTTTISSLVREMEKVALLAESEN